MRKISSKLLILSTLLLFLFSSPAFAQTPYPVKDSTTTVVGAGGTDPGPGPGPGPGPAPTCTDSDLSPINNALKQDYGMTIKEGPRPWWLENSPWTPDPSIGAENANCEDRRRFWKMFSYPTQSWKYKKRLLSQDFTIQLFHDSEVNNFGVTTWPNRMQLKNGAETAREDFRRATIWIIHESGHLLKNRDTSLENDFPLDKFRKSDTDKNCYDSKDGANYFLKSYSLRTPYHDVRAKSESQAEATTLYVFNKKLTSPDPSTHHYGESITDFKNQCPKTYDWIGDKIFNNYDFGG